MTVNYLTKYKKDLAEYQTLMDMYTLKTSRALDVLGRKCELLLDEDNPLFEPLLDFQQDMERANELLHKAVDTANNVLNDISKD